MFVLKNNATPCGVSTLFQRLNQPTEEVKRQGTTTANASRYRDRELGAVEYDPLCALQLIHRRKMKEARTNPAHHPPDVSPQVGPRSTLCCCMPLFCRKCGAYHSDWRLRATHYMMHVLFRGRLRLHADCETVRRKSHRSGIKRCVDAQPIRIITQVGVRHGRFEESQSDEYGYPSMS